MSDVAYAESLMRQNYEAVGFIPRPRLEQYALRGQLLVESENGEPCGYLVFGKEAWPFLRVYQSVVQFDARRREHGVALVQRLVKIARERGAAAISLWCADDLEANAFWRSVGFAFSGQRQGGKARGRKHNRWMLTLSPGLFADDDRTGRGHLVAERRAVRRRETRTPPPRRGQGRGSPR